MWHKNAPLYKVMIAVGLSFWIMLECHARMFGAGIVWSWRSLGWILIGAVYVHFFEYFYHRVPMHRGVKHLEFLRDAHDAHHQMFAGANFQRLTVPDPKRLISHWLVFPSLFIVHYGLALLFLPNEYIPVFFIGVCFSYAIFELCHWFTHLKDNWFDRILFSLPLINILRRGQILHHRVHHMFPVVKFNFTPPYAGDRIFRTMDPKRFIKKINNPNK